MLRRVVLNAMALIETAEGEELIVEQGSGRSRIVVIAGIKVNGFTKDRELTMFDLYKLNALDVGEKPHSRSDLTAAKMSEVADLMAGWCVAKGRADRRSDVSLETLEFQERAKFKEARKPAAPTWEDDWPADGNASDKVRYLLEYKHTYDNEEMAVIAGCSRSLVSELKD